MIVAAGLLLTAAAIGVIVARFGGDDGDSAGPSPGTDAPPAVSEPEDGTTTDPSNGTTSTTAGTAQPIDGLAVVDSGFSTYEGFDGPAGSYGLILENTSDQPITHFAVQVVVYDTTDTVVGSYDHDVAVVNPGARLGLGAEISDPLPNGIGRLDIRTEEGGGDPLPQGAFTVSDVSTSSDEFGVYTTFVVSSSYDVELELSNAYAVYRDAVGRIIGGANGVIDLIPPRGRASGEVTAFAVVPNVARADVYIDPG
ncbi:MAG: FxLYD domain-containing protein [Acidimicrobiales bacterium]